MQDVNIGEHLRERIEVLCAGLEATLTASSTGDPVAAAATPPWPHRHSAGFSRTTRVLLEVELLRLQWAISRLDAGTYGHCFRCRNPLTRERLDVDLAATFCAPCLQLLGGKPGSTQSAQGIEH